MWTEKLDQLKKVIEQLTNGYEQYIEIAKQQRYALVNNDMEALNLVNRELDEFSQMIAELERNRIYLMGQLGEVDGVEIVNVKDLVQHYDHPTAHDIYDAVKKLKNILVEVRKSNNTNHSLIQNSREFVRSTMALVTGYHTREKSNKFQTYGNTGSINSNKKQIRTLYNKEV